MNTTVKTSGKVIHLVQLGSRTILSAAAVISVTLMTMGALSAPAFATVCILPDNGSGTVDLPPDCTDGYVSPSDFHLIIDGLPPGTTIQVGAEHERFLNVNSVPGGTLGGEVETFNSTLVMNLQGTGDLVGFQRTISLPASCETHTGPRTPGDAVQTFPNEMVQLQGELFGDPDFDFLRVRAGSGFGLPSPGHTTLTRLGPPGSDFAVDSFFDISYRIEFQGAPGSVLDGFAGTTTGTVRMQAGEPTATTTTTTVSSTTTTTLVVFDHLKCYKIKDPQKLKGIVDLDAAQDQFDATNCKIVKAKKFCVPVMKTVDVTQTFVDKQPVDLLPIAGRELVDDYICYTIKCKEEMPPDAQEVVDQFGQRVFGKFKAKELCVPARKVAAP